MSKRKTRQQKIIADLHRKLESQNSLSSSAEKTISPEKPVLSSTTYSYKSSLSVQPAPRTISMTIDNRYIRHDLIKTSIVTAIVISAQLLLFFLLKNHIIAIPMVRY